MISIPWCNIPELYCLHLINVSRIVSIRAAVSYVLHVSLPDCIAPHLVTFTFNIFICPLEHMVSYLWMPMVHHEYHMVCHKICLLDGKSSILNLVLATWYWVEASTKAILSLTFRNDSWKEENMLQISRKLQYVIRAHFRKSERPFWAFSIITINWICKCIVSFLSSILI